MSKKILSLVITKGQGVRGTLSEIQTLLLQRCALHKFHVTDGQNTGDQIMRVESQNAHDQIAFCSFYSFLVKVQMNTGYIHVMHA